MQSRIRYHLAPPEECRLIALSRPRRAPTRLVAAALSLAALALGSAPALTRARDAAPVAATALSPDEAALVAALAGERPAMETQLRAWVEQNTGTWNRAGLQAFARTLRDAFAPLGFEFEPDRPLELDYPGRGPTALGPLLVARRPAASADAPRLLLVGHYDTVFEPDSPFQHFVPVAQEPDRATGPGVADMKGGLVVLLFALRQLADGGHLNAAHWTLVFNPDEEIGSLASRPHLEAEARAADYGLVFESAGAEGAMVASRRGLGQFYLSVRGVAAHAGSSHAEGRSAVRELAHKVLAIEALTDYDAGVTLNTGAVRGGSKRNIVPDFADAWIDLRYDRREQGERVREQLQALAQTAHVDGTTAELWGTLHRPPKRPSPQTRALLALHRDAARALGVTLPPPTHAGGGTDGSLTAAVGLATLDSLGVRGGHAHTEREFVELDSLTERAALAAILMRRLALRPQGEPVTSRGSPTVIAGSRSVGRP